MQQQQQNVHQQLQQNHRRDIKLDLDYNLFYLLYEKRKNILIYTNNIYIKIMLCTET